MPLKPLKPSTLEELALQEILQNTKPAPTQWQSDELPPVKRPGMFSPDPTIVGDPMFVQMAHRMLKMAPELRSRTPNIMQGPNEDFMELMDASPKVAHLKASPDYGYGAINKLGLTNMRTGKISVNPGIAHEPGITGAVMAHELMHAGGHDHGPEVEAAEQAAGKLFENWTPKMKGQK